MNRGVKRLLLALLGAIAIAGASILWVETSCIARSFNPAPPRLAGLENEASYRRAEGDSYLTFPEWNIVYAYADLAGVTRQRSESKFDYLQAITGFWSSLCTSTRVASGIGPVTWEQKATNYIIALSFSAEMAIKGVWERTIGAITVLLSGDHATAEDRYAQHLLEDYAAFLKQTPWYKYRFADEVVRFWLSTPFIEPGVGPGGYIRKVERRIALTLEWSVKSVYASAMAALAGLSPADLRIKSVVAGLTPADIAADPRIKKLREVAPGQTLIETPRYDAFTDIMRGLSKRGRAFLEIAGAHRILTTVIARDGAALDTKGRLLFSNPVQAQPGFRRLGYDVDVRDLTAHIAEVERQGAVFEHAYDY